MGSMSEPDASGCVKASAGARAAPFGRLKRRAEFQRVSRGCRWQGEAFVLQAAPRRESSTSGPRVGFTATRKTGGAVERNRLRRRLKEALRLAEKLDAKPDHDYVLIARRGALSRPFELLRADLNRAFAAIHQKASPALSDRDRSR
jgi:ribonuclease P protein component